MINIIKVVYYLPDRLNENLSKDIYRRGKVYKQLFENFVKLFYKPKKRGYVISKEFQNRVNNIIERES